MKKSTHRWLAIVLASVVYLGMVACSGETQADAEGAGESGAASEEAGEHAAAESGGVEGADVEASGEHGEGGEGGGHDEEGEESGVYIGRGETWDAVRRGARLVLKLDPASNACVGTVENTTAGTLCSVRVEVHLSTGTELGPTPRTDVPSGQKTDVTLATGGEAFDTWTAHPEVSACSG